MHKSFQDLLIIGSTTVRLSGSTKRLTAQLRHNSCFFRASHCEQKDKTKSFLEFYDHVFIGKDQFNA